jgi:hypothetical protein
MKVNVLAIILTLILLGCVSKNPYNVTENEGAYLQNSKVVIGDTLYICGFKSGIRPNEKWIPFSFSKDDPTTHNLVTPIPEGSIRVGITILYYPNGGPIATAGEALKTSFGMLYSPKAWARFNAATSPYEILVINSPSDSPGMKGIELNAVKGTTYQINSDIKDGKAYIWIEDDDENKVSDVVRGIGLPNSNFELWENLPPPSN